MPKVTGLSHVVLHVNDLDKMIAFYRDVLGLTVYHEYPGRLVFLTADPTKEDHELALMPGRQGDAQILHHFAWHVESVDDVKAFYERFKVNDVPIDHMISHAYVERGNTVSCYFNDPEGNRVEVFAMVPVPGVEGEDLRARNNRPLDLARDVAEIVAQAKGLATVAAH